MSNTLFDTPRANSRTAQAAIKPLAAQQRETVYAAIRDAGARGLTDEEIQDATGIAGNAERPRRGELVKAERIVQIGNRKTRSGRNAAVWRVK